MFAVRAVVVGQTVARVAVDAVTTRAVVLTRVTLTLVRLSQRQTETTMPTVSKNTIMRSNRTIVDNDINTYDSDHNDYNHEFGGDVRRRDADINTTRLAVK